MVRGGAHRLSARWVAAAVVAVAVVIARTVLKPATQPAHEDATAATEPVLEFV